MVSSQFEETMFLLGKFPPWVVNWYEFVEIRYELTLAFVGFL
jgi:hypothetical protein